jgi:RNA polymerase sigma-70 factor (ECF subfamily)
LEGEVAAAATPDPLVRRTDVRRVRDAIRTLTSAQRRLIEMHWFEELTYPEIAERVGASPGAVKLRAFRAHAALRQVLKTAA